MSGTLTLDGRATVVNRMRAEDDIQVHIVELAGDEEAAEQKLLSLSRELRELSGVTVASTSAGAAPAGFKSLDLSSVALVISSLGGGALLPTVVKTIGEWLNRQPPATELKIKDGDFEFEWSGTTPPAAVERLIAQLVSRRKR
jgi:hypothetical protein